MTVRGFSVPLSPHGTAGVAPRPPWHYAGHLLVIDFWADPEAVADVLPPGLAPSRDDPGRATAYFGDWQYASDGATELLDPARGQYREFFVTVAASFEDVEVDYCPYIYVNHDGSMGRGWIQGFPKKFGSVHITRSIQLPGVATAGLRPGTRLAGTCSVAGHRLAEATVLLEQQHSADGDGPPHPPLITRRYFPRLARGRHDDPALDELVSPTQRDSSRSSIWSGPATLDVHDIPGDEAGALRPAAVGRGQRYSAAFTVDDLRFVKDLRNDPSTQ